MIVLDTSVLLYAVGAEHRFRQPCRDLLQAIENGALPATTTVEVMQEFTHVRARRRGREDAVELARSYIDLLSPLLVVKEADLREGLHLYVENDRIGAFDAILAAAARAAEAAALVSTDGGFTSVSTVRHVIPDEAGVRELLESK